MTGGRTDGILVKSLQSIHALKAGALAMFDPMLREVAAERDDPETGDEVRDLLGRMHGAFSGHRAETARHVELLAERLGELGAKPRGTRVRGLSSGARAWVRASGMSGTNHGANARNAFVFEHLEVASLSLLAELAERTGDEKTAEIAKACLTDDREMAATIDRNWTNVLTLSLSA
jgi:ferritin-like metal-binding protein YciE